MPVRTLTDICRQYCVNPIHFLKIDGGYIISIFIPCIKIRSYLALQGNTQLYFQLSDLRDRYFDEIQEFHQNSGH